jgi:hypothetical protein
MEKRTVKSSRNSSIPSSQTAEDTTKPSDNGNGSPGQAEELNGGASNSFDEIEFLTNEVVGCSQCGEYLQNEPTIGHERRTLIDIEYRKIIRHEESAIKHCRKCGRVNKGHFSPQFHGPLQYGPVLYIC